MPFAVGETPERLKGKGIPAKFVRLFVHVWNSVHKSTGDETRAYKAAYKKMGEALRTAGYKSDKDGKWRKTEEGRQMAITEGWLTVSQNTLDDGDFAWISDAYRKAKDKSKMNKGEHRKLPYKIHGKVNVAGWRAAWIAVANPGTARALKSYAGGPSREEVLAKLRRAKPSGITIEKDNSIHGEEMPKNGQAVLAASKRGFDVLEDSDEGLKIAGVALIDGAISSNNRYYSAEFNDKCMAATNKYMAEGGTVTIYSRHGNALGKPGEMPTALPIGKVTEPLYRNGSEIWYNGFIAPTTEGKDVITLVKTKVMLATSIRAPLSSYKSRMRKMNGREVEEALEAVIVGIDLTDDAGIKGAGIRRVLEEAPIWDKEDEMDWEKVTLEDLVENCKQLLDGYAATIVEAVQEQNQEKVGALETSVQVLTEEKDKSQKEAADAAEQATGSATQIAGLELKLKIAEAAQIGSMSKLVFEELTEKVKTEEDIATHLTEAKEKAMALVLSSVGDGIPKGTTDVGDDDKEPELTEEAQKVLSLAA